MTVYAEPVDLSAKKKSAPKEKPAPKPVPALVAQPVEAAPEKPAPKPALPSIFITGKLSKVTDQCLKALITTGKAQRKLFEYGDTIVRLRFNRQQDNPRLETVTAKILRTHLDRLMDFMKQSPKGEWFVTWPPMEVIDDILSQPGWHKHLPGLTQLIKNPYIAPDWQIVSKKGYDEATGIYLSSGLELPAIPETPTPEEVQNSVALLKDNLLVDFPFTNEASRAHAIALLLTMVIRPAIQGPTPVFGAEAFVEGTGKGLLLNALAMVATGKEARSSSLATGRDADNEIRKAITSLLLEGEPIINFDNVNHRVDSGPLAAALTAVTWNDRMLGYTKTLSLPVTCTWCLSGNNLDLSNEIARRTILIKLDAKVPNPSQRGPFKHDPLLEWTKEHRPALMQAVLVLVKNWLAKGRPLFTGKPMGSYEHWAKTVGGILTAAGIEGFLCNLDELRAMSSSEFGEWSEFVKAWWFKHKTTPVRVGGFKGPLLELASALLPNSFTGASISRSAETKLAGLLRRHRGRVFEVENGTILVTIAGAQVSDPQHGPRPGWCLTVVRTPLGYGDDKGETPQEAHPHQTSDGHQTSPQPESGAGSTNGDASLVELHQTPDLGAVAGDLTDLYSEEAP